MLLMVEKGIIGRRFHAIHRYVKANDKCIKDYAKDKETPYLKYQDVNKLYGRAISQKLPVNDFKWVGDIFGFDEILKNVLIKKVMKDIFLKLIFHTQKIYITFTMIYLFLPERVKIQKALSHGLVLKKVNRNTKFNKKAWLKQYIDTNTELRKKKKQFRKRLSQVDVQRSFWENHGKCLKTQEH